MMRPGVFMVALMALGCALSSPQSFGRRQTTSPPRLRYSIAKSMVDFATDITTNHLDKGNLVFSPFSIVTILNLLLLGAKDNTYEQLRVVLKYPFEMEDLLIHQQSGLQLKTLNITKQGVNVKIANRIFIDTDFTIDSEFMRNARDYYHAGVEEVEFSTKPKRVSQRINQWVNTQTNGKIEKLFDSPPPRSTRMIGANAVYFNSSWQSPFDPRDTKMRTFHLGGRLTTKTSMMFNEMEVPYVSYPDESLKAIALPYTGGDYAMYIFLPDEAGEAPLAELERTLANGGLQRIVADMQMTNISVWLPRFKLESTVALRDVLQNMGATDLFQVSRANLARLSPDRDLFLSEVLHQAVIDVHEAGTEAAAVTVTLVNRDRLAKEFRVNRPFVFVIRDIRTKAPLFWGRIVHPE